MPKHNNCSLHTILLGFTLTYFTKESLRDNITKNFTSDILSYNASGLTPITAYTFQIAARTSVGVGPVIAATIQSGIPPVLPGKASRLAVSNIDAQSVVLQFTPGFDGNTSITKWTVEASTKKRNESSWFIVDETSDPDAKNVVVHNLIPFTEYRLRLLSTNVVGTRPPSEPTKYFQTIQAPPSHAPYNVTVRAVNNLTLHKAPGARPEKVTVTPYTTTSVKVEWQPIPPMTWNGDFNPAAYKIEYCMISAYAVPQSTDCPSKR